MRHGLFAAAIAAICLSAGTPALAQAPHCAGVKLSYPAARQVDQTDNYHGTVVADPYRWLEDPDSAETRAWVDAENRLTRDYLARIPQREAIRRRLTQLANYERYDVPTRQGGRYFYRHNDGLQERNVLFVLDAPGATPRVLIDPATLSSDGTLSLSKSVPSRDGTLLAYMTSASGSDWKDIGVRDVATGKDLPDRLKWVKHSTIAWAGDGKGFYYSRYPEQNEATKLVDVSNDEKVMYHRIGTPQGADVIVYARPDHKEWEFVPHATEDGRYLVIEATTDDAHRNRVFYKDLTAPRGAVVPLIDNVDAGYDFIANAGPVFYFTSNRNAPRQRVVAIDTRRPQEANWKTVVPERAETLQEVHMAGKRLVLQYLRDAHSVVYLSNLDGTSMREIALPGIGTVFDLQGRNSDPEMYYGYDDFTTPGAVFQLDTRSGKSTVFRRSALLFDPSDYETRQQFYTSRDGTRVPMFIVSKKGLKLDGNNPTYLYGYGGFNIPLNPGFGPTLLAWMEMGGVFAMPNLRGGGEYGEAWHEAGIKLKKQNTFDDFIAAAQWLIDNKVTSPAKLSIGGGSAGGLLVGAVLAQRPDLFAAAIPEVGVMDMLRFQKFTTGRTWISDYGSPDDPEEFKAIYKYSPLHNLKAGTCYPATLIVTADHDDRVVPAHSFKFTATMQADQAGANPVLARIDTNAGHGAGRTMSMQIDGYADYWAFLFKTLGMDPSSLARVGGTRQAGGGAPD